MFVYGPYKGGLALLWWLEVQLFKLLFYFTVYTFKVSWYMYSRLFLVLMLLFLFIGRGIDYLIRRCSKPLKKTYDGHTVETVLGFPYRQLRKWGLNWLTPFLSEIFIGYNIYDTDEDEYEYDEQEIPEELQFCQIFKLTEDEDLHIIKVEYCPDETAFVRIVGEYSYTKPYKRKVQRDKRGERFILFNNERFYLDPNKTQPRMPE
jgi:hypothetical protein